MHQEHAHAESWQRAVPLIDEAVLVLRALLGGRSAGPVFLRELFQADQCPIATETVGKLATTLVRRVAATESAQDSPVTRACRAQLARTVWRDAGATKADRVRNSFIRLTNSMGLTDVTCPKSWRHTFATLLQDANIDPLVRQLTLGHAASSGRDSPLGMTSHYTHTRPETLRREIFRALRLWPDSLEKARVWASSRPTS